MDHLRLMTVSGDGGRPDFGGGLLDGIDDVRVAGAAAQVPAQSFGNLLAARDGARRQQVNARHDHARRAVAALQAMTIPESLLQRMQMTVARQAFDGGDVGAVRLHGEHRARLHRLAVDEDGTGAANARLAANVRPGQTARIAQIVHEQDTRLDGVIAWGVVDAEPNRNGHGHLPVAAHATPFRPTTEDAEDTEEKPYGVSPRRSSGSLSDVIPRHGSGRPERRRRAKGRIEPPRPPW